MYLSHNKQGKKLLDGGYIDNKQGKKLLGPAGDMEDISEMVVAGCTESNYIKPLRLHYKQDGEERIWDLIHEHDGVCVLLFNRKCEVLVFVEQFRPAVYFNSVKSFEENEITKVDCEAYPGKIGITLELCAGIVDKDCSLQKIIQEEIIEECGYKVPLDKIEKVTTYRSGVSTSGSLQTLFYAEITDEMKVNEGGGLAKEGEMIEVLEVPVKNAKQFIMNESVPKPAGLMFAVLWFLDSKWK